MSRSSRFVAVGVNLAVDSGATAQEALADALRQARLTGPAAGRAVALAYAACRLRRRADLVLEPLLTQPLSRLDRRAHALLRVAVCELLWMDSVLAPGAVNEYVDLARGRGVGKLAGLVNAVLRRVADTAETLRRPPDLPLREHLCRWESLPDWQVDRWLRRLGPERTRAMAAASNAEPPVCLRVNARRCTREALLAALADAGVAAEPGELSPLAIRLRGRVGAIERLPGYAEGWFSVQDEGAMLIAALADAAHGQLAIDLCAAPGGKATHLAEAMDDAGEVIACDRNESRLALIDQATERLGLRSICRRAGDSLGLANTLPPADVVLLDAPCTGTGTLARRADRRWRLGPQALAGAVVAQRALLAAAAALVRPGGVLVYATCSLEPEENEQRMAEFDATQPGFHPDTPVGPPPGWDQDHACLLLQPAGGRHDGFYMARRRRERA